MKKVCRVCGNNNFSKTFYPDIYFNKKYFTFYKCNNCKSFNLFPIPTEDDFALMYGETDHSYLNKIDSKIEFDFKYPFGSHQRYQLKFLKEISHLLKGKTLLDYACGSGFYMKYANNLGAKVIGIEFGKDFVELLKKKTDLEIYTYEEFKEKYEQIKFDFIHLGHILEHVPNPMRLLQELSKFANEDTLFIIDGPLERNFCLSRFYIDLGSILKSKKYIEIQPQHLTLTNAKSQLMFFEKVGLKKERFKVVEQFFPLPNKFSNSLFSNISFIIAFLSIILSSFIPNMGNVFHFRGKFRSDKL